MTRALLTSFGLLGLVFSFSVVFADGAPLGPLPNAKLSVGKLAAIDGFIQGEVDAGRIPGAIVLVQQHGQPVYLKSFGKRDVDSGTPMTLDTIFPIHSV